MTPDLFWVPGPWSGRLAIAGRPRGGDWLADELRGLRMAGINTIVSLLEPHEAAELTLNREAESGAAAGLSFISLPIADRGVPRSAGSFISLAAELEAALGEGRSVAIHCRQSVGRAGLMAAAVLAASGVDPRRAIETVSAARGQAVPETAEQREWLLQLPTRVSL